MNKFRKSKIWTQKFELCLAGIIMIFSGYAMGEETTEANLNERFECVLNVFSETNPGEFNSDKVKFDEKGVFEYKQVRKRPFSREFEEYYRFILKEKDNGKSVKLVLDYTEEAVSNRTFRIESDYFSKTEVSKRFSLGMNNVKLRCAEKLSLLNLSIPNLNLRKGSYAFEVLYVKPLENIELWRDNSEISQKLDQLLKSN